MPKTLTPELTPKRRPQARGAPRGKATNSQRRRMLEAALDAVEQDGYAGMTVDAVVRRARVSLKTFYDTFADREDCFMAACEDAVARAGQLAREAYDGEEVWREGVRSALARLLMLMDAEPALARLCVVETLAAGEAVRRRRMELLDDVARQIDRGRALECTADELSELTGEGLLGGVLAVLHRRLLADGEESLIELLGPLMSMIVLPYMGVRAARRELTRPLDDLARKPRRRRARARPQGPDPLAGLELRLTYRTVRVLMAVAEQPGASNRDVAEGADVVDEGQISKLLSRLAGLSLLENRGAGQASGAANAWYLTPRGVQVEQASRPR